MNPRWLLLGVLALAPTAQAGTFDPRLVAADATWVLHVDFEGLVGSTLLRTLHQAEQYPENDLHLDQVKRDFGVDPLADLRAITMYGVGPSSEGIATVVVGSTQFDSAWTRLGGKPQTGAIANRDVLRIGAGRSASYALLLPTEAPAPCMALIATSTAALQRALAVLQGKAPSLGAASLPLGGAGTIKARPTDGSLVFAASVVTMRGTDTTTFIMRALSLFTEIAVIEGERKREFAALVRGLEFDLSETRGSIGIRLAIDAAGPKEADQLEQILRASVTPLIAASKECPGETARLFASLLEPLRIESPVSRLLVSYRYSARTFVADLLFVEKGLASQSGH